MIQNRNKIKKTFLLSTLTQMVQNSVDKKKRTLTTSLTYIFLYFVYNLLVFYLRKRKEEQQNSYLHSF